MPEQSNIPGTTMTTDQLVQAVKSIASGALKGNTVDTLGAPVDIANTIGRPILEKIGMYSDRPYLGSKHLRGIAGMEEEDANIGETAGGLISLGGASKAMIIGVGKVGKTLQESLSIADTAKALEKSGASAEQIFQKTGLFRDTDGKLRGVISDAAAKINPEAFIKHNGNYYPQMGVKLGDVITHNDLFEKFPKLQDVNVDISALGPKTLAYVNTATNTVSLGGQATLTGIRDTLLHEMQHLVQKQSGHARGSSIEKFIPEDLNKAEELVNRAEKAVQTPELVKTLQQRIAGIKKNAFIQYSNVPGEQEARFTQTTKNLDTEQLKVVLEDLLASGKTPQTWDTKPLIPLTGPAKGTK
jgi:hypothetical protein